MNPRPRHRLRRRRRRRVVTAAGCLGGALVVAAMALLAGGGREPEAGRMASVVQSTTTSPPPPPGSADTTVVLVPVTTGVPVPATSSSTTAPPAAVRVAPVPTVVASRPAQSPALSGQGAILTPPVPAPPPRAVDKAKGCYSAVDPGWRVVECGALRTSGVVLLWVVEGRGKGLRVLVLREQAPAQWGVVLAAADDDGTRFSSIGVRAGDVSGDGHPELAFGFHRRSPDRTLALDLVESSGSVGLHRDLARGSVVLSPGELVTWSATPDGRATRSVIRRLDGAWRVATTEVVDRAAVPPSMV